jgi:hypothetical protein
VNAQTTKPMTRRRRIWIAVGVIVGGILVLNLVAQAIDRAVSGTEPSGTAGSSYATKPEGLAAYATLLDHYGHTVRVQRGAIADNPPAPDETVVVIEPNVLTQADTDTLLQFVAQGGRLVIGGRNPFYLKNLRDRPPTWSDTGKSPWLDIDTSLGNVHEIVTASEGSFTAPGSSTPLVGDQQLSLLTEDHVGRGTILFLADASPLTNEYLSSADNAALGLALAGDRTVVFAEGVHGFGNARGFAAIPGGWKIAFLLVGVAAIAYVWSRARRFGPPDRKARDLPPARAEYVQALSMTLERTRDRAGSLAPAQQFARNRVAARAGLDARPTDEQLARAARDLGCSDDEIAALLGPIGDDTQVLALGRATARVAADNGRTQ